MNRLHTLLYIVLSFTLTQSDNIPLIRMTPVDVEALILEDENAHSGGRQRYAQTLDVNIDLFEQGALSIDENGDKTWELSIKSGNAIGLKLHFNEFYIPEGGSLMIYGDDGMFDIQTYANNHPDEQYVNRLLKGELITLEYFEPYSVNELAKIKISKIYHAYKDVFQFYESSSNNDRGCSYNVACDEQETGGAFEDQINSVIFLDMNNSICSAVLVNNTAQDLTPYVLTANHCVATDPYSSDNATTGITYYYYFYFNHQSSSCNANGNPWTPYNNDYVYRGTLVAAYGISDFALFK